MGREEEGEKEEERPARNTWRESRRGRAKEAEGAGRGGAESQRIRERGGANSPFYSELGIGNCGTNPRRKAVTAECFWCFSERVTTTSGHISSMRHMATMSETSE